MCLSVSVVGGEFLCLGVLLCCSVLSVVCAVFCGCWFSVGIFAGIVFSLWVLVIWVLCWMNVFYTHGVFIRYAALLDLFSHRCRIFLTFVFGCGWMGCLSVMCW